MFVQRFHRFIVSQRGGSGSVVALMFDVQYSVSAVLNLKSIFLIKFRELAKLYYSSLSIAGTENAEYIQD